VPLLKFIISFNLQGQKKPVGEVEYAATEVNVFVDVECRFLYS
jgi:hypothetical protein